MSVDYCSLSKKLLETIVHLVDTIDCNQVDCCQEHDGILLSTGNHVITFKTDFAPTEVYVALVSPTGVPVCSANLSTVCTSLLADGFVLYATVAEDSAVVKWIVKK